MRTLIITVNLFLQKTYQLPFAIPVPEHSLSIYQVNISMLVRYVIQIIGSIAIMFAVSPKLTGVLLAVVPLVAIGAQRYGKIFFLIHGVYGMVANDVRRPVCLSWLKEPF